MMALATARNGLNFVERGFRVRAALQQYLDSKLKKKTNSAAAARK